MLLHRYVGGYTVKLNLFATAIGSVLDQRGDRTPKGKFIGFSGDAHVAQATSMAAFGNFALVKSMQRQLSEFDSAYGTYCMYWVLSLADYFAATADVAFVKEMLPRGVIKMVRSKNRAMPKPLPPGAPPPKKGTAEYAGWDERFNFAQLTPEGRFYPETGYVMRALFVQAAQAFGDLAEAAGNASLATLYRAEATAAAKHMRSGAGGETPGDEWWRPLGLHAAAHAANAGLINATEAPLVFAARFNESSKVCSFSNFNQYFVLQGIANLGYPKHALASIELCWGTELALGATSFWEVSGYGGGWASALGAPAGAAGGDTPAVPGHSSGADSKCHPWASGVTAWLSHEAAGLRARRCDRSTTSTAASSGGPAPLCVTVRPLLGTVAATLPTLHGDLSVSVDAATGTHSVVVPAGVDLVSLSLPLAGGCAKVESVTLNGVEAPAGFATVGPAPWRPGNGLFDSYVHCDVGAAKGMFANNRRAGMPAARAETQIQIRVRCEAATAAAAAAAAAGGSPEPPLREPPAMAYGPPSWDVPLVGSDATTQGGWVGLYGSRGHLMFGLAGVNGSSSLAQPYLVGVEQRAGKESTWRNFPSNVVEPTDPRYRAALQLPCPGVARAGGRPCVRGIGNLATTSIEPMNIEVMLRPSKLPHVRPGSPRRCLNISLYFVDWDGDDDPITGSGGVVQRKTAVDVFTVAPGLEIDVGHATTVVGHPDLAGGVYRTWRACEAVLTPNATGFAAVRFRVYIVTGFNATVSAVFFD